MPAPHPPEFRQRAVELARQGTTPVSKIAKDLGISDSCLRNWIRQADADENPGGDRLSAVRRKNSLSCGAVTGCWRWKTTSSGGRRRISRGRTSSQSNLPAGP